MRFRQILMVALVVAIVTSAFAHRSPPPVIAPVIAGNVKLVARYTITSTSCVGLVEALPVDAPTPRADTIDDRRDHQYLWRAEIFRVPVVARLEQDAQWVFLRSMSLRSPTELVLVNERSERSVLDLATQRVRREY